MPVESSQMNDAVERVLDPVVTAGDRFEHVMALHFDPFGDHQRGIIRGIVSREGSVGEPGFVDRSRLFAVDMAGPYDATITEEISIENDTEVLSTLPEYEGRSFLGFEDPNLWRDRETGILHLYCTIPFLDLPTDDLQIYLGHAEGDGLDSLTMTDPVLDPEPHHVGAKEVAIAPPTRAGPRNNLVESSDHIGETNYSVLRTAIADDLSGPWEYGGIALHPNDLDYDWCAGHLSTGPLLPQSFLDVGEDRRVGLINGREPNHWWDGREWFGEFSVGLMLYDFETGSVEWVSDEPLIRDPDAETITFASAFRQLDEDTGVVYAHVDDAYVRAYRVDANALEQSVLP